MNSILTISTSIRSRCALTVHGNLAIASNTLNYSNYSYSASTQDNSSASVDHNRHSENCYAIESNNHYKDHSTFLLRSISGISKSKQSTTICDCLSGSRRYLHCMTSQKSLFCASKTASMDCSFKSEVSLYSTNRPAMSLTKRHFSSLAGKHSHLRSVFSMSKRQLHSLAAPAKLSDYRSTRAHILKTPRGEYPSLISPYGAICKRHLYSIVVPGKVSDYRPVPAHIVRPPYIEHPELALARPPAEVKTEKQIQAMRDAGAIACAILQYAGILAKPGVTTDEIDAKVHDMILKQNAYPSPLGYRGYPKSVCTSVNNVACHGIPDDRPLQDGDIVNIDVTVYYNGFHGDCSETFLIGSVDEEAELLVEITRQCRDDAIMQCGPGVPFSAIGNAISILAESLNFTVMKDLVGHGIGEHFHGQPDILHYRNNEWGTMKEGMTFTIEPILSAGGSALELHEDGWTLSTADQSRTAQSEHTVLVTGNGVEVLTAYAGDFE